MAVINPVSATSAGLNIATGGTAAAAGGDTIPNGAGDVAIYVTNANGGAARTVTIDGIPDLPINIPLSSSRLIGPAGLKKYNDASGQLRLSYSDSGADITVLPIKMRS